MAFFVIRAVGQLGLARNSSSLSSIFCIQTANISSAGGKPREPTYKPFDYRRKKFTHLHQPFDRTRRRYDENSRVIIIDGPMASGKHELGRQLAKQLDFKFVPQANYKDLWKCPGHSGLTYQDLDALLPERLRLYDLDSFYSDSNPKVEQGGGRAGWLQIEMFKARLYAYNDALLHLLSTGQGVVCVRSPWSDRVFAKALRENGYMSQAGFRYYEREIAFNHLCDFPRPHLVIYLDADVETTKGNIKKRGNKSETQTAVLDEAYLKSIENEYKNAVLPSLETHGELLVYPSIPDITDHEVELLVEDIEALGPMEHSGFADDHFLEDWSYITDEELAFKRREYQDLRLAHKVETHNRPWDAPEMLQTEDFSVERSRLYDYTPGYRAEPQNDPAITPMWKIALGMNGVRETDRRHFWLPK